MKRFIFLALMLSVVSAQAWFGKSDIIQWKLATTTDTAANAALIAALTFDYAQTICLGKHGDDANDGLSEAQAKLTLGAAIITASALTPASDNRIVIKCNDAGIYAEENVIPSYVTVMAPSATFESSTSGNTIQIEDEAYLQCFEVIQNDAGPAAIVGGNQTGDRWVQVQKITATGSSIGVINFAVTTDGSMSVTARDINVATGTAISDNGAAGDMMVNIGCIYVSGNSGKGISMSGGGLIHGRIGHIEEDGTPSTTIGFDINSGECSISSDYIDMDVAMDVESGATLNLISLVISGTQLNDGTLNVASPAALALKADITDASMTNLTVNSLSQIAASNAVPYHATTAFNYIDGEWVATIVFTVE